MKRIIVSILVLFISSVSFSAGYTIIIPDNIFVSVIDAVASQHGYEVNIPDPDNPRIEIPNPESKIAFVKRMNRRWIRLNVQAWEANQSADSARKQAIIDAKGKTESIRVQ